MRIPPAAATGWRSRAIDPEQLNPGEQYTLITCSGMLTGEFAAVTVPDRRWYVDYLPDGSVKLLYSGGTLILIQ